MVAGDLGGPAMTALAATGTEPVWLNDAELIAKYDGRAPRYTSYPDRTAFSRRFRRGPGGDAAGRYCLAMPALSLYFHVPFCRSLCWFCGCHTEDHQPRRPDRALSRHLLRRNWRCWRALAGGRRIAPYPFRRRFAQPAAARRFSPPRRGAGIAPSPSRRGPKSRSRSIPAAWIGSGSRRCPRSA